MNIVAIPDAQGDHIMTQAAYTYCQNRKDCFFVADTPKSLGPQDVFKFRMDKGFNSSFGALVLALDRHGRSPFLSRKN